MSADSLLLRLRRLAHAARDHRPVRFVIVGAANTLFGYSIYLIFLVLIKHSAIALTLSCALGAIFNFFTTGRLVFNSNDRRLLFRFCGVYLALYLVNLAALRLLESQGLGAALAQAALVVPMALCAYLLQRDVVFARSASARGDA